MNFSKISKIMLILIILVVFANIAFASDDALADGNVTLADDSSSIEVTQDASLDEDVLSVESDSSLPSDDLEGMSGEDVVSAYNQPHLHFSYRVLNDTVYTDDVFRIEVNVTNDGNTNFADGVLRFNQVSSYTHCLENIGFKSDSWKQDGIHYYSTNYDMYVVNNKTLNVGDSALYYIDIKGAYPGSYYFRFYVNYVQGRQVYTVNEQNIFEILPPNVTMTKKSVNGDVFYVDDEIIYNVTLTNNHYGQDGKIWKNLTLIDQFSMGLKFNDCKFYNSNGELVTLDYEFDNYERMFSLSIPELIDNLTIQFRFKAWAGGDLSNKVSLYKPDENSRQVHLFDDEAIVHVMPKIKFTKEALAPSVYQGQTVSFKLTVNNTWDRDISNFIISDKLDSYFSYEGFEGDGWVKSGDSNFKYTGTLAPGEVAELVVTVKVSENYPMYIQSIYGPSRNIWTNTASFMHDGKVVQDSANVEILPSPLSVNKRSMNESVQLGDNVTFELVISDTFNQCYPYVEISDIPSDGLEFLSCYGVGRDGENLNFTYVVNGTQIIFKIYDFNATACIYTTFKATETGWHGNGAALGRPSNPMNYKFASVYVYAPIYVEKHVVYGPDFNPDGFYPEDNITYEVYVYNPNEFDLTNVVMTELCPENLTFLSFEGENWTRTGENTFAYNGKLGPYESTFIYLKFNIKKDASGLLLNNVTVGSDETDNVTAICGVEINDIDWDDYEVYISKSTLTPSVEVGDNVTFAIMVRADGKKASYNVDIIDIMPNGLEFLRCYMLDDEGNEVPLQYSINGSNLKLTLEVNGSATVYTEFRANEAGTFYNYARLSDNPNNYARAEVYVSSPLMVSKSLDASSVIGGSDSPFVSRPVDYVPEIMSDDLVVFNIFLSNYENYALSGIVATEVLPEGFKIVSYESKSEWRQISDNSFTYTGQLRANGNARLSVTCKVPGNITGQYVNKVTVTSDQTDAVNASCVFKVVPPSVDINKISLNSTVNVGDNVYFDILVKNIPKYIMPAPIVRMSGESSDELLGEIFEHVEGNYHYYIRHNLEVVDTIPEGLEFESCYAIDDFGDKISIDYRIEGNKVIFTIPTLVKFVTIRTTFKAIKQGNQVNTAEVPGSPPSSDKVFVENSNMTVEKITNNLTVHEGEQVSFTIVVKNTGNTDLSEVFVEDTNYTEGIVYDSYANKTGSGWKYSSGKFVYDGILKAGESASFDVIFNTTKTGKFNNTVVAGSNATDNVTSTNITNVIGDVPEDDPDKNKSTGGSDDDIDDEDDVNNPKKPKDGGDGETPDKDDPNPTNPGSNPQAENEDSTDDDSQGESEDALSESEKSLESSSSVNSELATGNPILVLLMVLISIVGVTRYSKK